MGGEEKPRPEPGAVWLRLRRRLGARRGTSSEPAHRRTAVVTDSAAALPSVWSDDFARQGGFRLVPLPVLAGDEIFLDGSAEVDRALAVSLAAGQSVKTSRPSPGEFARVYRELAQEGYEEVVSLHLSGGLSGTSDSARLGAAESGVAVTVIDSGTAGMGLGFAVQAAVQAAETGTAAEVERVSCAWLEAQEVLFYLPSLEQLRRGGRIGAAASLVGAVLAIKPILAIEAGRIVPRERVRTAAKAVPRLRELALAAARARLRPRIAVHYFGNEAQARAFAEGLGDELRLPDGAPVVVTPLPAVLAAHTGVGVLAVVVVGEPSDLEER